MQNRKARKITTQNTAFQNQYNTLRQQTYREGFKPLESGFGTDSEDDGSSQEEKNESDDDELFMYEHDNKITQGIWLPQEPRLFVLYIGGKFLSYGEDNWADGDGEEDASDADIIDDPRTHFEMVDLQNITNFS